MISPPDSVSSDGSTSTDGFDRTIGARTESQMTSTSSVLTNYSKSLEERGQSHEILSGKVAPEEQTKSSENVETLVVTLETPHSRVRQEFVSVETLRTYHIDHYIDIDPEYIIITRSVPDYEMNFLKRHTEELRKKCIDQTPISQGPSSTSLPGMSPESAAQHPPSQGPDSNIPLPPTVNLDTVAPSDHLEHKSARSGNSDTMTKSKGAGASGLLLQTNRMQFEKWQAPTEENKRGECVLDVAMQPKEVSETTPTVNRFDSKRPLDFGSSDAQENFDVPVRLAINSRHVQVQLNKITGFDMDETDNVLHPPWKLIATYHEDIKRHFQELEKKATKEQGENLSKEDEHPEQAPAVGENEPIKVDAKIKVREQAGDGSILQLCEVCGSFCHEKKLECLRNTVSHLKCFVDFIDNDLKHVFELRHGLANGTTREIAFEDLWHLFSPGDLLVTSGPHRARQAYKVFHTSGGRPVQRNTTFEKCPITTPFTINCYYINFDKKWLGPVENTIIIPRYDGKRLITALTMTHSDNRWPDAASAFPIRFLEEPEIAIADLVKRGRRHRELTPFSHKRYCGPSSVEDPEYLNSEIIIDFEKEEDNNRIGHFGKIWVNEDEVAEGCTMHGHCYECDDIFNDNVVDDDRAIRYKQDQHLLSKRDADDDNLTDDHYMLLPADVNAFVLRERATFSVFVDLVKDLDGDHGESLKALKKQSGFEDLVLPEGHGDLVEALVRSHRSTRNPRDEEEKVQVDLIDGKGEGLVILLHGVPGVGKTSTAECVAAYTRRPLYPITCANIGLNPEEVEENLTGESGHFRRAQQWNCVVLLDEADVFLAKRETRDNDAKRNALVSVFLRFFEYYPGILILTTNRVGSFDEAVISRIQLFLYYPPLDEDKTMKVWRVYINRVRSSGIINIDYEDEASIMEFAEEEYAEGRRWNGRQIRNFFQTAISLASYDATKWRQRSIDDGCVDKDSKPAKPRLTTRTLKIVAATSGKFIDYINSTVPDGSHQKQQLDEGNRNDCWEETPKRRDE